MPNVVIIFHGYRGNFYLRRLKYIYFGYRCYFASDYVYWDTAMGDHVNWSN